MSVTLENTAEDEEDVVERQTHHRHYDAFAEDVAPGSLFPSNRQKVGSARKRKCARLGVSRVPFIEPLGANRENSYEARLLLGLPCVAAQAQTGYTTTIESVLGAADVCCCLLVQLPREA